jgi:hypothetical protein
MLFKLVGGVRGESGATATGSALERFQDFEKDCGGT